ncbi:MarR family transcriptional regulator [Halobacteriales archaeon SW_7_71_33]|nr:MAG: MarR family transcriptional regulator [Halobacteriales archaeon SW_7_71_33]
MTVTNTTREAGVPGDIRSPQAKLVYHSLDVVGAATVDDLADRLNERKITLLEVLDSLAEHGHVERRGRRFVPVGTTSAGSVSD